MGIEEYVHALGEQLEACTDTAMRVALARMLAATASPDAHPYLLEALAAELDDEARAAIKQALATLSKAIAH